MVWLLSAAGSVRAMLARNDAAPQSQRTSGRFTHPNHRSPSPIEQAATCPCTWRAAHAGVGRGQLVSWAGLLVDDGFDLALGGTTAPTVATPLGTGLGLTASRSRPRKPPPPKHPSAGPGSRAGRGCRRIGKTHHQVAPAPGDASGRHGFGQFATHGVVHHVGAFAVGQRLQGGTHRSWRCCSSCVASAPMRVSRAHFSSVEAAAITRAPAALAICTAAVPTPPAAPSTSTVSPAFSCGAVHQGVVGGAVGEGERRQRLRGRNPAASGSTRCWRPRRRVWRSRRYRR